MIHGSFHMVFFLFEGPMANVCNALEWARYALPRLKLKVEGLKIVAIWSSWGQLAMSLGWAVLAFYSPTNYEDQWWRTPIQPRGAEDKRERYGVLARLTHHQLRRSRHLGTSVVLERRSQRELQDPDVLYPWHG
jgi:hypothetical protein